MRPWNELTLAERRKFTISHRRNPRAVYEKIRKNADGVSDDDGGVTPEPEFEPVTYNFTSYADAEKQEEYATGTAETTGVESNGYSQIEVLTNSVDGFVGNKYYITSDANADGSTAYELYSDAGTTGTGIYVTITEAE